MEETSFGQLGKGSHNCPSRASEKRGKGEVIQLWETE